VKRLRRHLALSAIVASAGSEGMKIMGHRTITRATLSVLGLTGLALSLAACGSAAASSQPTSVATKAPYSDPHAKGYIGLCDKSGHQITSGSLNTVPFAWKAVSSQPAQSPYGNSYRTAILLAYQPQAGLAPGEWSGEGITASSRYTDPSHPMAAATPGDGPLMWFTSDFHPSWDGFIELRMYLGTAGAEQYSLTYPALNLQIEGNTWYAVGGGKVDCNAGRAVSIESILLPKYATSTTGYRTGAGASPNSPRRESPAPSDGRSSNMNGKTRRTLTGAAAGVLGALSAGAAVAGVGVGVAAGGASAATPAAPATAPPWEPDPNSVGSLVFYNSAGQVITGGSTASQPVAAYVLGTGTPRAGDTKATLYGFLPVQGQVTGQWSGEPLGASTAYPNTKAPAPLNTSKLPVETGGSNDESIATLALDWPNGKSPAGYTNMYQLRLYTSKPGEGLSTKYDSADIIVNSNNTWSVVYSPQSTTATLLASPATVIKGQKVTLTAKVAPASAAGTVQFFDGAAKLGNPVTVSAGTATTSTTGLPGGVDSLSALFTPANTGLFRSSKTSVVKVTVKTPTVTKLTASPIATTKGGKVTLTATEAPVTAGKVQFYVGTTKLGSPVTVSSTGVAVLATTSLPVGTDKVTAAFSPTSTTLWVGSSGTTTVTVKT
jgi:hypothetical protein